MRPSASASVPRSTDERVCIVTVGGSGVGADLLGRVIASFAEAKRAVPQLRG
jgi:predicted glycosyltransferase